MATLRRPVPSRTPSVPGPRIEETVSPPGANLVRAYLQHLDSAPCDGLPAHLFVHWSYAAILRAIAHVPGPLHRALNVGCRIERREPLRDQALRVSAQLVGIERQGCCSVLDVRVLTGPVSQPAAVEAHVYLSVPETTSAQAERPPTEPARVPNDAREVARWRWDSHDSIAFATLTGDLNPIHWAGAFARANGFDGVVAHGFALLARSMSALDSVDIAEIDVRFPRPLHLPATVALYLTGQRIDVADGVGDLAFLSGSFRERGH